MIRKLSLLSIALVFISILVGLGFMVYLGYYNRYWSDDWCYERDLEHLGILRTISGYFFTGDDAIRGYSTNRYGLTLITALFFSLRLPGTQLLSLIIIVCLSAGMYLVSVNGLRSVSPPRSILVLMACFFTYYLLYFSPHRFQILYWRAGVHYTATIISTLALIAILLFYATQNYHRSIAFAGVVLPALIGGGLSEIGCIFMLTGFIILLIAVYISSRNGKSWAKKAFPLILLIVLLLVISMFVLILSPSNDRYRIHTDNPIPVYLIPIKATEFAIDFITASLKSLPLPHFILGLFFACIPVVLTSLVPLNRPLKVSQAGRIILLTLFVAFILIIAIQTPTTYFYGSPPDARGQSLSRFIMFAALAIISGTLGLLVNTSRRPFLEITFSLIMLGIGLYSIRLVVLNMSALPGFIQRAQAWDTRDAMIRSAVANGQTMIEVPVIDTHEIETRDIIRSIDTDEWISTCASEYYGAQAFHAISP